MAKQIETYIDVISHYDLLIDEDNDPVHDPEPLQEYMNKWDGSAFIEQMQLDSEKSVLEIGVGTGRLAIRVAPMCGEFCGIDISSKTIDRANYNLAEFENVKLICADFLTYEFNRSFDVIYSSLTFMHIKEKKKAVNKVVKLLNNTGKFVLSIDKNPNEFIDTGTHKIKIYPDIADAIAEYIKSAGLTILNQYDTEFANIFISQKNVMK
ncbi:MAG: class I SAM-dependent methyltransferase [Eubacterium sp.]|nr:class I SAM-dependent methyltransferase [Eubacterium sp.]